MRFSILTGILVITAVALTCALAGNTDQSTYFMINGVLQLVMVGSLAMPFVCKKEWLAFWAAYGVTVAFVLLRQGQSDQPFKIFLAYTYNFILGDVSELQQNSVGGILYLALQIWSPVWLGAIVGGCFALLHRMATPAEVE